jgi:hypothetical protein
MYTYPYIHPKNKNYYNRLNSSGDVSFLYRSTDIRMFKYCFLRTVKSIYMIPNNWLKI